MNNKNIIIILLIILLGASVYFNITSNNKKISVTDETLKCIELWEKKKDRIFANEIGNYRVIWSEELNTCLAGNIYDEYMNTGRDDEYAKYFIFVIDLLTDEVLLGYQVRGDAMEDSEGVKWEEAIKQYENFGLRVF